MIGKKKSITVPSVLSRMKEGVGARSDSELARLLGVTAQAVSKAKNTGKVPAAWVRDAAQRFELSTDWLFFARGIMRMGGAGLEHDPSQPGWSGMVAESASPYGNTPVYRVQNAPDIDMVYVPKVEARLAAGSGSMETSDQVQAFYGFRSDWIHQRGLPARMVLMDITGDSMEPELHHGDTVLIDQGKTDIYGHGYYAVGVEDAIFIKQLDVVPGKLILRSLNPRYEPIEVNLRAEQPSMVRIIGRAIWSCRELM